MSLVCRFGAAAFAAQLPYVTFSDGSPRAFARGIIPNRKARFALQRCGLGESCEAAVDVGYPRHAPLQAILIELRSCGSGSPAGRALRCPGKVAFGSKGSVLLSTEVATRGRMGSAPTQPRMRRIESTRSETHNLSKTTPPHATSNRCRRIDGNIASTLPKRNAPPKRRKQDSR